MPTTVPAAAAQARWALAADASGSGSDALLAVAPDGTVNALVYTPGHGFSPAFGLGRADVANARGVTVGYFTSGSFLQLLATDADGVTRSADRPTWGEGKAAKTVVTFG